MCRDARIALTAAADALERERWRPIAEMHEDYGLCIVYDMVNGGEPAFLDVCEDDFAETAKEYTHFRSFWLMTEEAEALGKERA